MFHHGDTVKALIESLGVPHTEVDLILVNGQSAAFDQRLCSADRISVYPMFESLEIGTVTRVRPSALRRTRFVLDVHLGALARLLRMMGFDALYANNYEDAELTRISVDQRRILCTRDRQLLQRSVLTHAYCVRSVVPRDQLREVLRRFDLKEKIAPFSRCLRCNDPLAALDKREARRLLPKHVARTHKRFSRCPHCGRVYWRGSHWERMSRIVAVSL